MRLSLLPVLVALAGCGSEAGAPNGDIAANAILPAADAPPTDAWVGRWAGVEGLALDVGRTTTPGDYALQVTLLDGTRTYAGTAAGDAIRFERDGVVETIRAARGADTGLKWLAEKEDCLVIKPGEGFCRD